MEMHRTATTHPAAHKAIARALANGGASAVTRLRYGLYTVRSASRPGTTHRVSVDTQGRYSCSCPAGVSRKACWHCAAVVVAKIEDGTGCRVTGPGTRPASLRGAGDAAVAA